MRTGVYDLVNEYFMRQRLAKLGIMASDIERMDAEHGMSLLMVDAKISKVRDEMAKKQKSKGRGV
jgi:hypothetical protein